MSRWRDVTLGDLVVNAGGAIRTGPFGSQLHAHEYTEDPFGIPVVMPKDMVGGRVNRQSVSRVSEDVAERLSTHRLAAGDLVLARRGDVGRFAFIEDDEVGWLCGTGSMRVHAPDRRVVWPRYLRYAMADPAVTDWLVGRAVGATMPNLNDGIVAGIPVHVPDLDSQRRVAAVLGAFDELIELNEQRIQVLEDLARSLYNEWFVRLRFPGDKGTDLVDSELGPIPRTWSVRRLSEVASQITRGVAPRYAEDGTWVVLNQRCIRDERVSLAAARQQDREVSEAKEVRFGDVLINSTGVGTLGRVAMFVLPTRRVTADSHVTIVRSQSADAHAWLGLCLRARQSEFAAMGTGSTGQTELSRQAIGNLRVAVPDGCTLRAFSEAAWPLLNAVPDFAGFNDRLAATQDLLLPRLVTGRLDISDVDLSTLLDQAESG